MPTAKVLHLTVSLLMTLSVSGWAAMASAVEAQTVTARCAIPRSSPSILGKQFYIFYTSYPNNGLGWPGASVKRFTVSCQ